MSGPRLLPGAPVPLFDRLVDADIRTPARQGEVMAPLDRDRLILSIALEVSALVNTRCPRSRGEMAGLLGTTIETVSRQFAQLEAEALIRRDGLHYMIVEDVSGLEAVAG